MLGLRCRCKGGGGGGGGVGREEEEEDKHAYDKGEEEEKEEDVVEGVRKVEEHTRNKGYMMHRVSGQSLRRRRKTIEDRSKYRRQVLSKRKERVDEHMRAQSTFLGSNLKKSPLSMHAERRR